MTSNIGSTHLLENIRGDGQIPDSTRQAVMSALRAQFRPEFLNRVDETVLFKPLTVEEITGIVELLADDLRRRLRQQDITLQIDKEAELYIAKTGYDPVYGARPLKRFIQQHLETPLSRGIIAGDICGSAAVDVSLDNGKLVIKQEAG